MQTDTRPISLIKMGSMMALACLVPLLALAAIFVFQIPINTVALFAIVLVCPIIHLFMMRNHDQGGHRVSPLQSIVHSQEHEVQE